MGIFIKVIKLNYMHSENVIVHLEALARHSQLRRVALEHWVTKWVRSPLRPGRRSPGARTPAGYRVCRSDTCAAREATGRCSSCGTRVYVVPENATLQSMTSNWIENHGFLENHGILVVMRANRILAKY